jgi:hypothetical protein
MRSESYKFPWGDRRKRTIIKANLQLGIARRPDEKTRGKLATPPCSMHPMNVRMLVRPKQITIAMMPPNK